MEILLKLEFKILLDIVTCLVMFIWSFNKFYDFKTIETIDPDYQKTIGSSIDLSFLDIKAVNLAYCSSNYYFNSNILSIIFMVYLKPHARILWPVNEMDT